MLCILRTIPHCLSGTQPPDIALMEQFYELNIVPYFLFSHIKLWQNIRIRYNKIIAVPETTYRYALNDLSFPCPPRRMLTGPCEQAQDLVYTYWIRHAASLRTSSLLGAQECPSWRALERLFRYFQQYDIHIGPGTQAALTEHFRDRSDLRAELGRYANFFVSQWLTELIILQGNDCQSQFSLFWNLFNYFHAIIFLCFGSGYALIWLSWIRIQIRTGNSDLHPGVRKLTKMYK